VAKNDPPSHVSSEGGVVVGANCLRHSNCEWEGLWWTVVVGKNPLCHSNCEWEGGSWQGRPPRVSSEGGGGGGRESPPSLKSRAGGWWLAGKAPVAF